MLKQWLDAIWARRPIKEITPAEHSHPDGFVYKVMLEYRLAPGKIPFIRITDDGNITGAKICSAEDNSYFVAQFGGEDISPPLYAHIYFTSVNPQRQKGEDSIHSIWDALVTDEEIEEFKDKHKEGSLDERGGECS